MTLIDNRGLTPPKPLVNQKRAAPTQLDRDIEELGFAFLDALRARGHRVHAVTFEIWETPKKLAREPVICIAASKIGDAT